MKFWRSYISNERKYAPLKFEKKRKMSGKDEQQMSGKWGKQAKPTFHKKMVEKLKVEQKNELSATIVGKMRIFWGNAK